MKMKKERRPLLKPYRILKKNAIFRQRVILAIILLAGFGAAIFGLARAQIIKADYFRAMAEGQQLNDTAVPAERGIIYDRNMTVLAQSATVWDVSWNPSIFDTYPSEAKEDIYNSLSSILGMTREELEEKASYKDKNSISLKTKVKKDIRDKVVELINREYKIEISKDEKKTYKYKNVISISENVERFYPYKTLAAQVIGCIGSDNNGLAGVEAKYDSMLTGVDGRVISVRAASAAVDAAEIEYQSIHDPVQGTSLVLTIDETIQRYLDNALSECYETSQCDSCYGIVMDVKTGAILAMSTQAGYDPTNPYKLYNERSSQRIINEALEDIKAKKIEDAKTEEEKAAVELTEADEKTARSTAVYSQWRNRAISDTYEPGSVYKVITMAAGLEENVVSMDEQFNCTGSIHILDRNYFCHNHSGHGTEDLTHGLMNSCNPYFITIGQRLGVETFYKYLEAFGFTEKTGIDLSGEASPVAGVTYFKKEAMTGVNLASCSFGQSFQVSAIQMLNAINAVANDGKLMTPYVVAKTLDSDGNVVGTTTPVVKRQVISESTSDKILEAMEQVSTGGTAKNSYVAGFRVAGKTGTSDKLTGEKGDYIASFAGCAPANDPEISIIIVVDKPQGQTGGGAVAAPVAAEVIENTLTYLNIERQYNENEKDKLDKIVPNVVSKTVSAARETIYDNGFKVKIIGEGDTVVSQMPAYDSYIPQGGVIVLYTEENYAKVKAVVPDFAGMTVSEANYEAATAGINIKISGNALTASGLTAYRQSIEAGKEIEYGSSVTVYFRTTTGVDDH